MSFDQSELLAKSPLSIVISDKSERVVWCNSQFLADTHQSEESVIGNLYAALPLEAINTDASIVQLFIENSAEDTKFQYWQVELKSPSGAKAHYFTRERNLYDKKSLVAAKLTGAKLPKRASWVEFLDYEVSRSRRYDNPLSLLKLHLLVFDKPSNVNEETLHHTIKDTLMDELRWADMISHTDHGTYLMVLPETPMEALSALQEKLNLAIERQINFINDSVKFKLVFGEAHWQKNDDSQTMLKRARDSLVEGLESLLVSSN